MIAPGNWPSRPAADDTPAARFADVAGQLGRSSALIARWTMVMVYAVTAMIVIQVMVWLLTGITEGAWLLLTQSLACTVLLAKSSRAHHRNSVRWMNERRILSRAAQAAASGDGHRAGAAPGRDADV